MSPNRDPHRDTPSEPQTADSAPDRPDDRPDDVEHGLGTGTPAVLREAAREVRRDEEQLTPAAARRDGTPSHWRDVADEADEDATG